MLNLKGASVWHKLWFNKVKKKENSREKWKQRCVPEDTERRKKREALMRASPEPVKSREKSSSTLCVWNEKWREKSLLYIGVGKSEWETTVKDTRQLTIGQFSRASRREAPIPVASFRKLVRFFHYFSRNLGPRTKFFIYDEQQRASTKHHPRLKLL